MTLRALTTLVLAGALLLLVALAVLRATAPPPQAGPPAREDLQREEVDRLDTLPAPEVEADAIAPGHTEPVPANPEPVIEVERFDDSESEDLRTLLLFEAYTPESVARLFSSGIDPNTHDRFGWTPLIHAAYSSESIDGIALLIEAGSDLEARAVGGWTPLLIAAAHNPNAAVVALLLERGADPAATEDAGLTALELATAQNPNPDVAQRIAGR